ncbi:MAG: hypothetical protein ACFB9N_12660 [Geitlerinemataceae cyanobacterium]
MHLKSVQKIVSSLHKIASNSEGFASGDGKYSRYIHEEISYALSPELQALFSEQVSSILNYSDISEKFTEKYISKQLREIVVELLRNSSFNAEGGIQHIILELEAQQKQYSVYLALNGVKTNSRINLGAVSIIPGGSSFISDLNHKLELICLDSKLEEDYISDVQKLAREGFEREFSTSAVIEFCVRAEPSRAKERAREESQFAVDILRLISKCCLPMGDDIRIGVRGEKFTTPRYSAAFSEDSFHPSNDFVGSSYWLDLNERNLGKARELGIIQLADRYHEDRLSALDEVLLRAIHWLSVAISQDEPETSLITLFVALECIFKQSHGSSISSVVCESTAFLISDSLEGRCRISQGVRKLYGKRSAVSHGGKKRVTEGDKLIDGQK